MALHHYAAFGFTIVSELELPELLPGREGPGQVSVRLAGVPENLPEPAGRGAWYQVSPGQLLLKVPAAARYLVSAGEQILVEPAPGASDTEVRLYLLGSALAGLLHQRGMLPIQGSAIATPRGAAIFAGPSGHGKSTLAWELNRRGYPLVSDDVAVIDLDRGRPVVHPAYPKLNRWVDSTQTPSAASALPLFAVYILDVAHTSAPAITRLTGLETLQALTVNTYRRQFLDGLGTRSSHFRLVSAAASGLRACRVARPAQPFEVRPVADLIEKDVAP